MLLGHIRDDLPSSCRSSRSAPHLTPSRTRHASISSPLLSPSMNSQPPMTSQQAMMHYARMSYRYTTVTLLSLRPPPEVTIFPEHLVERRFLDEENYIDLDRMLAEKAGKFRMNVYGMRDGAGDGPTLPTPTHRYDFSDPVVVEKVKNRRPKDLLTPHQVAALTSVVTRHQTPTPLLSPHQHYQPTSIQRNYVPTQRSMPFHRQSPSQHEPYAKQNRSPLPSHLPHIEPSAHTIPILQRLFQAQQQRQQQNERHRNQYASPYAQNRLPPVDYQQRSPRSFYTPSSSQQSNSYSTFAWPFATNLNEKPVTHPLHIPISNQTTVKQNQDVFNQLIHEHLRSATTLQTPISPSIDIRTIKTPAQDSDDDDQNFYSAPPSPTQEQNSPPSLLTNSTNPEQTRIYNQAVLLNSLIRNMVNENGVKNSSSNESCLSTDTQSTNWSAETNESYTDMYNLIRLLSPGVKNVAQQELLQYLEQGCSNERAQMLHLISSLNPAEQNSLKPVLVRLINEQLDIMKSQQQVQQGNSTTNASRYCDETRSPLESWFGTEIYRNAYPRMPSDRVVSAYDLEQSRLTQKN